MKAWHGSQQLKDETIALMQWHIEQDALIRGTYWNHDVQKGCMIGCLVHDRYRPINTWHEQVEIEFGIPVEIAEEMENTFEWLAHEPTGHEHQQWTLDSLEAISSGADLSGVIEVFDEWLVGDYHQQYHSTFGEDQPSKTPDEMFAHNGRLRAAKLLELLRSAPVVEEVAT